MTIREEVEAVFEPKITKEPCEYITTEQWIAHRHPRGGNYPPLFIARYRAQQMVPGAVVGDLRKYKVQRDGSLRRLHA